MSLPVKNCLYKSKPVNSERGACLYKKSKARKNQINMTPPKETNTSPITVPEEMKICELLDKKFRIIILKKFSEPQVHTDN